MLLPGIVMFDASAAQDTYSGANHRQKKSFYGASAFLYLQLGIVQPLLREVLPHREKGHVAGTVSLLWPADRCRNESSSQHRSFHCHSSN